MAQSTAPARQLHVEAMQTVTPAKSSEPGRFRHIISSIPLNSKLLRSHLRLVLYYKSAIEDKSGHTLAGWFKESLNATLAEHPVFAGRLRRAEEGREGKLDLKFNDSGVRLVQAQAEMTLSEFMDLKGRDGREAQLAYWQDVDENKPQFSALCYVQVTSFQGEGYSVGLSCSVLLADPIQLTSFLKTWAQIYTRMLTEGHFSNMPIFHLSNLRRPGLSKHLKSTPMDSAPSATANHTVLFELPGRAANQGQALGSIANLCFGEATTMIGGGPVSEFYLVWGGAEEVTVESHARKEGVSWSGGGLKVAPKVSNWDLLNTEEVAFGEGNTPAHVSCQVESEEGIVLVMDPSDDVNGLTLMSVTVPEKI